MHPYGHGTTHRARAIYNHLPGSALTPQRRRNLPSWRSHTTSFILWIEGKQNLIQKELDKDYTVSSGPRTRPSHTSCVGRMGHTTQQSTGPYPSVPHADPQRQPVYLGEKSNDSITGKQLWLVWSFCREDCAYLRAAEAVGSAKISNVLCPLSTQWFALIKAANLSLLFLQTSFFVVDIWSGKLFRNHCNKLHLLASVSKIRTSSANQDISPAQ